MSANNNFFLKEARYRLKQGLQPPTVLLGYLISSRNEQSAEGSSAEAGGWTRASAGGLVSFTIDFICSRRRRDGPQKASAAGSEEKERSSLRSCACLAATRVAVKFGGSPAAGAPRNLGK